MLSHKKGGSTLTSSENPFGFSTLRPRQSSCHGMTSLLSFLISFPLCLCPAPSPSPSDSIRPHLPAFCLCPLQLRGVLMQLCYVCCRWYSMNTCATNPNPPGTEPGQRRIIRRGGSCISGSANSQYPQNNWNL